MTADDLLRRLARELAEPPFVASIAELVDLWQIECLRLECELPDGLEDHPELSVRVRGAFGRQLRSLPPRQTATGLLRPSAWNVLAAPLGRLPNGDEVPKPVVIRAGVVGPSLIIEMRVLGRAATWFDDAAAAMIKALEAGIALTSTRGIRVPIAIKDMFEERLGCSFEMRATTTASLQFLSPVLARQKHELVSDPRAILRGIVRRVRSVAHWQATTLVDDWRILVASIADLDVDDRNLVPYRWARYSIRHGNSPIPAAGWLGTLRINGRLERLAPYLALAATMNAGAQASLGLGWYELAMA